MSHAWYSVALPGGEWASSLIGGDVVTHLGPIGRPSDGSGVLFLDAFKNPDGGSFMVVGQSHGLPINVFWSNGRWDPLGPTHGVNPVIFDSTGVIHQATIPVGSQGYRFCDENNRLWTGDETYADPANRLWQWTRLGDVQVGLSPVTQSTDRIVAIYQGVRRVIADTGSYLPNSIRFKRQGDACALTYVEQLPGGSGKAIFLWFAAQELAQLPVESTEKPEDKPTDKPVPDPKEVPEFKYGRLNEVSSYVNQRWVELDAQGQINRAVARGDNSRETLGAIASEVLFTALWELHFKFGFTEIKLFKKGGTNHRGFAEDILCLDLSNGMWYSDVGGAFGSHVPTLNFDPNRFALTNEPGPPYHNIVPPPAPEGVPVPDPDPKPDPKPEPKPDMDEIKRFIKAEIEAARVELHTALWSEIEGHFGNRPALSEEDVRALIDRELTKIQIEPDVDSKGNPLSRIGTSRAYGHAHEIVGLRLRRR